MLLSIITINYNNAAGLQKTISSVVGQQFNDFEYIIIDGSSTDDSVAIIKKNQQALSYWVSEPDTGIYNAMNKGIAKAQGEYILMVNSGDYLVNNHVLNDFFSNSHTADILYGDVIWDDKGHLYEQQFPDKLSFSFFRHRSIGHQAAFVRRSVHLSVGLYDEGYKIISDWKFFLLAICKYNVAYRHVPLAIAVCGRDGISCLPENWDTIVNERTKVLDTDFAAYLPDYSRMDDTERELLNLKRTFLNRVQNRVKRWFKTDGGL